MDSGYTVVVVDLTCDDAPFLFVSMLMTRRDLLSAKIGQAVEIHDVVMDYRRCRLLVVV